MPCPVSEKRIDKKGKDEGDDEVGGEAHALGHGAGKIVVAVPQNMTWKKKNAALKPVASSNVGAKPVARKYSHEISPNMSPKPSSQNTPAESTKSAKFLMATLMEFFDRVIPDSRHMNPGCIRNTREAEMIIHNMSTLFIF